MPTLEFWYEFASPYSHLAARRIEAAAHAAAVEVIWRPFLLGPIFKAQGWTTSPFNLYPAKGRYMRRDFERQAQARGLTARLPDPFPAHGLRATRLALLGEREGWVAAFSTAVFTAEFEQGRDIADAKVLAAVLADIGCDPAATLARAGGDDIRAALRARGSEAEQRGIFGAPSFVTADRELFWGDDRLEQAFDWAKRLI